MANLNLEPFVLKIDDNRRTPVVRLSFTKCPHLWFNGVATKLVRENIGDRIDVAIDPDTRRIALTEGDMRKMTDDSVHDSSRVFIARLTDELFEVFGECQRVYFDVSVYENAILLSPNGREIK